MESGFRFSSERLSDIIPPTKLRTECSRAKAAIILFFKYRPFKFFRARKLYDPRETEGLCYGSNLPWAKS